jgi:hypothetical protein
MEPTAQSGFDLETAAVQKRQNFVTLLSLKPH